PSSVGLIAIHRRERTCPWKRNLPVSPAHLWGAPSEPRRRGLAARHRVREGTSVRPEVSPGSSSEKRGGAAPGCRSGTGKASYRGKRKPRAGLARGFGSCSSIADVAIALPRNLLDRRVRGQTRALLAC